MEQEIPKELKIDKRRISRPFPKKTELSKEQLIELIDDISNSKPIMPLMTKYRISYKRIIDISNKYSNEIELKRKELALAHQKQFVDNSIIKRGEILNSIDLNDIKSSKLHQKTAALVDLTNVGRLEAGLATSNVAVISKEMSDEQLKEYILNGCKIVTPE